MHHHVIVHSTMYVQINYSLAHLQDLIPTLAGVKYIPVNDNTSHRRIRLLKNALFVYAGV